MTIKDIQELAEAHGLSLTDRMQFNEMGIDFKVCFAVDTGGQKWILRIPRRSDMADQIEKEKRILELAKAHLSIKIPDWQISSPELVAYPMLEDKPVLTFDAETYAVTWNMDKDNANYTASLAQALVELHGVPVQEAADRGLKTMTPVDLRSEIASQLELVKSEIGISSKLERRYAEWLDKDLLWPVFTQFVHGDLYAGHVLTSETGTVSGIIDWSTAHVGDIAADFSGHATVFGEDSLKMLIREYEKQGGRVWDQLFRQSLERAAAAPLAYGFFAIQTKDHKHLAAARAQLGLS